ncbi:MAG: hypothetical protein FJ088_12865, partial [Deltaproteobacteria bacterium]|nr:hypothetical protein [Deltaproteobacteria bacterium]
MKSAIASFLFIVFAFGCSGGSTEDDKDVPHDTIIKEITDFELKDGQICFSSSKFCEGNDVYLCNAAGDKKSFLKACSKGCSNGECCQPVCSGMECGDDGCGGVCGTCTGGKECLNAKCECVPDKKTDCQGNAMYKFDSCGNPGAKVADCLNGCENAQCKNCVPDCADKECGDNGCGTPCGTCTGGKECVNNKCQCKPENYKECSGNAVYWFDSCGNKGSKAQDCQYGCDKGVCKACEPDCSDKECGDDGCGTPCGTCKDGKECVSD